MSDKSPEELFDQLEREYSGTRMISVVQRQDEPPSVHWDPGLTESDVIANLFKALLFMTLDEYVMEMFDDVTEEEDSEEGL